MAHGPHAKNGRPYSEEQNYTIIIGLEADFRDLVKGKARKQVAGVPAPCLQGGAAKIAVISESVPLPEAETLAPLLQDACSRDATPGPGKANANCTKLARELNKLAKGLKTLAASRGVKEKRQFKLRNDTRCPICFTYDRCNDYGCWNEVVRASGKSTLFAGVRKQAPAIKNPQFCKSGPVLAELGPPLPPRKPERTATGAEPEAMFFAAKEKARREGVWTLTAEDIRGLSLKQIRELRGY